MTVSKEMWTACWADYKKPEDLIGENRLLKAADQAAGGAVPR